MNAAEARLRLTTLSALVDSVAENASKDITQVISIRGKNWSLTDVESLLRFPALTLLDLANNGITNKALATIGQLRQLDWLDLRENRDLSDSAIHYLSNLPRLTLLTLSSTSISDASTIELSRITTLQSLSLEGTLITDAGLRPLSALSALQALYLGRTNVTDVGIEHLSRMKALEVLDLHKTPIAGDGLHSLTEVPLTELWLGGTGISDDSLRHVTALTRLESLSLFKTGISDAGIEFIANLSSLRNLDIGGTKISENGYRQLRRAFPDTVIHHDFAD